MPSPKPLPTISDLLNASGNAVVGERDRYGDVRRGSLHDHAAGPTAILFAREADRDSDMFRAIYLDDADGKDLSRYAIGHFGIPRTLDTYGQGWATFARANATAGGGTFLQGSRLTVAGSPPAVYVVAEDTDVAATATSARIPIRADARGTGTAIEAQASITLEDVSYDPLWKPTALSCEDGTDFEPADAFRARVRKATIDARNGYLAELATTCLAAGAAYVVAFPSQYGLDPGVFTDADLAPSSPQSVTTPNPGNPVWIVFQKPHGKIPGDWITISTTSTFAPQLRGTFAVTIVSPLILAINVAPTLPQDFGFPITVYQVGGGDYGCNALYVADKNFASSDALVNACKVALEGSRVLGADLWVGGIVTQRLSMVALLNLIDDPSRLQTVQIKRAAAQALLAYFGPTESGYTYRISALQGVVTASHPAIQAVTFSTPTTEPLLNPRTWPANLTRYTLSPRDIAFSLAGPV